MNRILRRFVGSTSALILLLAQLSLAAYACTPVPALAGTAGPAMHADCAGHPPAPLAGALCELHCQASLSVPASGPADIVAPTVAPLVVSGRPDQAASLAPPVLPSRRLAAATDPPVAIRFCRLLI
jgi:hypothetical protein